MSRYVDKVKDLCMIIAVIAGCVMAAGMVVNVINYMMELLILNPIQALKMVGFATIMVVGLARLYNIYKQPTNE